MRQAGSKGIPVCTFTVAVNNRERDKTKDSATFFRVTAWNKLADLCNQYLDKGRKVCVIGSVGFSEYEGKDGKQHFTLEVTASEVEFLGGKQDSTQVGTQEKTLAELGFVPVEPDSDLPF